MIATASKFSASATRTVVVDFPDSEGPDNDGPTFNPAWGNARDRRVVQVVLRYTVSSGDLTKGTPQSWAVEATLKSRDVLKGGGLGKAVHTEWRTPAELDDFVRKLKYQHVPRTRVTFTEEEI